MAAQIEKDACAFYQQAAATHGRSRYRDVFTELATMEQDHVGVFEGLAEGLADHEAAGKAQQRGQNWPLVTSLLASGIQSDLAERFTGREGDKEALEKALEFEKDTLVFFAALQNVVASPADKKKVGKIVTEELGHIFLLTSKLATLK